MKLTSSEGKPELNTEGSLFSFFFAKRQSALLYYKILLLSVHFLLFLINIALDEGKL